MGLLKKITKPLSKFLDKIVPNEIKPALPYLAAFAPLMMGPGAAGSSGFWNSMTGRAIMAGGANLGSQLAQEGSEGEFDELSLALASGIGALSAPGAPGKAMGVDKFDNIIYQPGQASAAEFLKTKAAGMDPGLMRSGTEMLGKGSQFLINQGDVLRPGGEELTMANALTAGSVPITQGTGDLARITAEQAFRDYENELANSDDPSGANDEGRRRAIRAAMEAGGHLEETILDALASLGLRSGGIVGLKQGGRVNYQTGGIGVGNTYSGTRNPLASYKRQGYKVQSPSSNYDSRASVQDFQNALQSVSAGTTYQQQADSKNYARSEANRMLTDAFRSGNQETLQNLKNKFGIPIQDFERGRHSDTAGNIISMSQSQRERILDRMSQGLLNYNTQGNYRSKAVADIPYSAEARALNMPQYTYSNLQAAGYDPLEQYIKTENRRMTEGFDYGTPGTSSYTGPDLLQYTGPGQGDVLGLPSMNLLSPTAAQAADPNWKPNPYSTYTDMLKYEQDQPSRMISPTRGMSAQDYIDINVLGLSGQEIAEKHGIPYAQGGRIGFEQGGDTERKKKSSGTEKLIKMIMKKYGITENEAFNILMSEEKINKMKADVMYKNKYEPYFYKDPEEINVDYLMQKEYLDPNIKEYAGTELGIGSTYNKKNISKWLDKKWDKGEDILKDWMFEKELETPYKVGTPGMLTIENVQSQNPWKNMAHGGVASVLPRNKEADYRGGGVIPVGSRERADDVPARLSKNEFVMTADAVRAAGGGSINKGAKRMYNLMHNLEARV